MFIVLFVLGCETETKDYPSYTTREDVSDIVPVDTSVPDDTSEDTGEDVVVNTAVISFETNQVSCAQLLTHTLNFTHFHPGFTNVEDGLNNADFYEEEARYILGDLSLTEVMSDEQEPSTPAENCQFSISLEEPDETDLIPMSGDADGLSWAFYYPSMFVAEQVVCDTVTQGGTVNYPPSCSLENAQATTPAPQQDEVDPSLRETDMYIWSTDIYPVYIKSDDNRLTGSFADMGFTKGWNLVQVVDNEITTVKPLSVTENSLLPISVSIGNLTPEYSLAASGTFPSVEQTTFSQSFTIGARPFPWINSNSSVDSKSMLFFQGTSVDWWFHIWGIPESSHFFSEIPYITEEEFSDFNDQWNTETDVAIEVPVSFQGQAGNYDSETTGTMGDELAFTSTVISAVCKNNNRVILAYYSPPRSPSSLYWFQQNQITPGWRAISGTHGESNTWIELTRITDSEYAYQGLSISTTCTLPTEWQ
jgi:hypothetical protein